LVNFWFCFIFLSFIKNSYYFLAFFNEAISNEAISNKYIVKILAFSSSSSDAERLFTYVESIKMGINNWFLGAGLGAFINKHLQETGRLLVVHNIALWVWAEFGIAGITLVSWFLYKWAKECKIYYLKVKKNIFLNQKQILMLGLFVVIVTMGMFHDMSYQRIFWFCLGIVGSGNFTNSNSVDITKGRLKP
jgi:hypothetical protein